MELLDNLLGVKTEDREALRDWGLKRTLRQQSRECGRGENTGLELIEKFVDLKSLLPPPQARVQGALLGRERLLKRLILIHFVEQKFRSL